jgi:hypothetical protein
MMIGIAVCDQGPAEGLQGENFLERVELLETKGVT